mmetsp:Transcript_19138/g.18786  ORF Transcript_19138/g.18786 Transcript_19138/m.18786 type:complete len:222 (+) Transcript_19138:132-797(+)
MLDTENEKTIYNWISQLRIQCEPSWKSSLFGSFYFLGVIFSSFILITTSKYGRRMNMIIGNWISLIAFSGLVFTTNLYLKYGFCLLLGLTYLRSIQSLLLATEFTLLNYKIYITTATMVIDGLVFPLNALYFKFLSKNWEYIFLGYYIIAFLGTILSHMIPESPNYLYEKHSYQESKQVLKRIAQWNNKEELSQGDWFFENEVHHVRDDETVLGNGVSGNV